MTSATLARLCKLWQKRLRLQDWTISTEFTPDPIMPDEWGSTEPVPEELQATIRIREDAEVERTLVHELLHLRLVPFDAGTHEEKETAINLIADCYLRAYPRRPKTKEKET